MVWWSFWTLFCVLWGEVHKASNVRKCRFKHIQLYRLEKVGLKALLEARLEKVGLKALLDSSQPVVPKCLEIPRFGRLPKPLQKLTVWWSFWQLFCVLWGVFLGFLWLLILVSLMRLGVSVCGFLRPLREAPRRPQRGSQRPLSEPLREPL